MCAWPVTLPGYVLVLMVLRVFLALSDGISCKGSVEVLDKGVSIVRLVVSYITLFHSGHGYYRGIVCILWKISMFRGYYLHFVEISMLHVYYPRAY